MNVFTRALKKALLVFPGYSHTPQVPLQHAAGGVGNMTIIEAREKTKEGRSYGVEGRLGHFQITKSSGPESDRLPQSGQGPDFIPLWAIFSDKWEPV